MVFNIDMNTDVKISRHTVIDELYQCNTISDIFKDWPSDAEKDTLREEIKEE